MSLRSQGLAFSALAWLSLVASLVLPRVDAQIQLLVLSPDKGQVWEALRALYLIGVTEDLPEVERYARSTQNLPEKIKSYRRGSR